MESATENKPPNGFHWVRVKTCGKSARAGIVICLFGKPHLEQGKIGKL